MIKKPAILPTLALFGALILWTFQGNAFGQNTAQVQKQDSTTGTQKSHAVHSHESQEPQKKEADAPKPEEQQTDTTKTRDGGHGSHQHEAPIQKK
ncbi:MAG: hypothetical protein CVU57_28065 [Deltaproteobacteria bacterium HGW-Deltaproteobacteria-15]|nr:MAG: hypothetical protein CVU57_28065 [Deltaproteobacteria bacterium HGW-Deltaproteobacteria-15]